MNYEDLVIKGSGLVLPPVKDYWYLASPYSKYERGLEAAWQVACAAASMLLRQGVSVYSPIAHSHPIAIQGGLDPLDSKLWMRMNQPLMDQATGLIVLQMKGWEESVGVQAEIDAFGRAGKTIMYIPMESLCLEGN